MIKMTIEVSPEQAVEIARLLNTNNAPVQRVQASQPIPTAQPTAVPTVPAVHATMPTANATPIPTVVPTMQTAPTVPTPQATPTVPQTPVTPPTAVRKYTMDELALASRPICEAGRQAELINLLHSFTYTDAAGNVQQVQSIQQLPESLYPDFANGIRSLGGKI